MTDDDRWLAEAVQLATRNVAEGGGPFGAVVVAEGRLLSEGQNRVTRDLDPTAHAEVVAVRRACRALERFALDGCTLYASCEPCPLCLATALWSRVDRVVYAADRHDAADAGFDDREFYELFGRDRDGWPLPVQAHRVPSLGEPFERWKAHEGRTAY
ncbi:nucleoside deaminase [Phycicoccus flavus]|uniref:nucleoside deaminase n=1 Tax=Phycicoccus flavus TaxID=2502783 RepID=UPI000FEC03AD|nr:nucleoside deaminase [Phycicoccus flavus]NHA67102.1 nucleoside deaminase [Phycicoccus flavus]